MPKKNPPMSQTDSAIFALRDRIDALEEMAGYGNA